jgi:hypothetical protein
MTAWDEAAALVGTEVKGGLFGNRVVGIEPVERSAIRRFCEPMEMDCPLHYDDETARAHGYRGVVAPVSSITQAFTDPGQWTPGAPSTYTSADPHAEPTRPGEAGEAGLASLPGPEMTSAFATDIEIEYFSDVYIGDHLRMEGNKLISCVPKETSVGRGAFMVFESQCLKGDDELVAILRRGVYAFDPHPRSDGG